MTENELAGWLREDYERSFRTACLILGNRADAEEAVQEAFLRAWRFRSSIGSGAARRPWLYRIVVNACNSKLRQGIPHRDRRAGDASLSERPDDRGTPDELASRGSTDAQVLAALADLPLHLREVVVLRYYVELSEREIATAIGRRPGTVKSRLHEARERLAANPMLRSLAVEPAWGPRREDVR